MVYVLLFWMLITCLSVGAMSLNIMVFKKSIFLSFDEGDEINGDTWFFGCIYTCIPMFQFVSFIDFLIVACSKWKEYRNKISEYRNEMNTLLDCNRCGFVVRNYQYLDEQHEKCCENRYVYTIRKGSQPEVYEFANKTGLTPEMSKQEAKKHFKAGKRKEKMEQLKQLQKENVEKSLQETKFIEEQTRLRTKKENEKLEKTFSEVIEHLNSLKDEEKAKYEPLVQKMSDVFKIQKESFNMFNKESKEHLEHVESKVKKIIS